MSFGTRVYIQDSDYETAAKNGILQDTVYARVKYYGWPIERAITQPVQGKEPERQKWLQKAKENGLTRELFNERLRSGWSYERAATDPIHTPKEAVDKAAQKLYKVFTKEQLETARANGIGYQTILGRVQHYGWPAEKAVTTPVQTKFRRKEKRSTPDSKIKEEESNASTNSTNL